MSQEHLREQEQSRQQNEQLVEAIHLQNLQLQLLRKLGISTMIEQEAETEIAQLQFQDDPNLPPTVDLKRTDKMTTPNLVDGEYSDKWILDPTPQRTNQGVFDTTLRIRAFRVCSQQVEMFANSVDMQSVLIEFTQGEHLQVVGDKTTFKGDLSEINEELLTRVQVGIKEAFTSPKTEEVGKMLFA